MLAPLHRSTDEQSRPQDQSKNTDLAATTLAPNVNEAAAPQQPSEGFPATPKSIPHVGSLGSNPTVLISQARMDVDKEQISGHGTLAKSTLMEIDDQHTSKAEHPQRGQISNEVATTESHQTAELAPPSSSLISPPASSNDDVGSSPINTAMLYSPSPPPSKPLSNQAPKEGHQRHTPESASLRRASSSSFEQRRQDVAQYDLKELSGAAPSSEPRKAPTNMADRESLRLIKELQVQEYGLRKRGKS